MRECLTLSYVFETKDQAIQIAEFIKDWANGLIDNQWVNCLFPVQNNILFVGDNSTTTWVDYDGKINKLPTIIHEKFPDLTFSGEQEYCNLVTGFDIREEFSCESGLVTYKTIAHCEYCGTDINDEDCYEYEDMIFCNENCAKSHIIERLMEEDDFDEEELDEKEIEELVEMLENY